jgi:hypothetical protein
MPSRSFPANVILYASIPLLFVFFLTVILIFYIFRYAYKWAAYGITAVKAFLAFLGEDKKGKDELSEAVEFSGFTYDPEQDIFFSNMDAWQREFGYCRLYDEAAAPFGMIVDSEPIYFDYGGRHWLIEFWKGQYDLTTGCEIGVYTTESPSLEIPGVFNGTFYDSGSNTDLLQMSYSLRKNNKTLFSRYDRHWWLAGFKVGEFSKPSELTMKIYIALKDEYMRNAFIKGMKEAGYSDSEIKRSGASVSFIFDKPKTRQPYTRTRLTDWIIQSKNKYLCLKYKDITGTYSKIQDRLQAVKEKSPGLYRRLINLRMKQKTYKKCLKINSYLN